MSVFCGSDGALYRSALGKRVLFALGLVALSLA